nr:hypothetical protein CFP56_07214 [Quercus suber]
MENLVRCKVEQSSICSSCNKESETVVHALWGCEKIGSAWGTLFAELHAATTLFLTFADVSRRNKIRVKEAVTPLDTLSDLAQQHL